MATKAWSAQQPANPRERKLPNDAPGQPSGWHGAKAVEEVFFQNEAVSLCLLVNRRTRIMRVIDFRAGPQPAKRLFVLTLAQREGVDKVYTLVERDEVATWGKLGFAREGNIPGFYKRSDAFILGCMVPRPTATKGGPRAKALAPERAKPAAAEPEEQPDSGVRVAAQRVGDLGISPAHEKAERTVVQARKFAKELAGKPLPQTKVVSLAEADARRLVAAAVKSGRALTTFEAFGRDVERRHFLATSRGGFELCASIESQACFGNTFLELLQSPKNDAEKAGTIAALGAVCEKLLAEGVVSCFSLSPSDDVPLATAFAYNGFRRTGLLLGHMIVGGARKDAILWSRKLANPSDE